MDATLPLEHLQEYTEAARYYALHGHLPLNMGSPGAIDHIQADPEAFVHAVKMEKMIIDWDRAATGGPAF